MPPLAPRLLLAKLTFGASPADLGELQRLGSDAWLARQLSPPADDGLAGRIAAVRWRLRYRKPDPAAIAPAIAPAAGNVGTSPAGVQKTATIVQPPSLPPMIEVDADRSAGVVAGSLSEHWQLMANNEPGAERAFLRTATAVATLIRATHSPWQLREVMADFWHNHFNVNAAGDWAIAVALPSYDRDVIRAHALGNFREMLEAVAKSAAMQIYLNNRSSRGGAANENYARELMELHTLGRPAYLNALYNRWRDVPGAAKGAPEGYIDQDVYEAARAFTGWTIEDGAGLGGGQRLPQTGKFVYIEAFHDGYQKRVLASEFEPFQKPMADGRRVLDMVAAHPATARYVVGKIVRRLVSDNPPPALVERGARVFLEHQHRPDQIARTIEAIVRSDEFQRSAGAKVKRPLELAAGFARATRIDLTVTPGFLNELDQSGQRLFGWGPPTGHPDDGDFWLSSGAVRRRWSLLIGLADDAWHTGAPGLADAVAREQTVGRAVDAAHVALLGAPPDAATAKAILSGTGLAAAAPFASRKTAVREARRILAYCALTPAFQKR